MINFLFVTIVMIVVIYCLFYYHHNSLKTLSASRWMILTWTFLFVIHIASPVHYLSFTLSFSTVIYCMAWIVAFCVGDKFGFAVKNCNKAKMLIRVDVSKKNNILIICLAFVGMLVLVYSSTVSLDITSIMASLRSSQLDSEQSNLLKTASTFMAYTGLVAFLICVSVSIFNNEKLSKLSYLGLISYFSVTFLSAGRSGIIFGIISIFIVAIASIQLSDHKNTKVTSLLISSSVILLFGISYIMYVVSTRTTGWIGSMDNKITFINDLMQSTLDDNFRESLYSYDVFGDMIIESFYYLSPQLYGLEQTIKFYDGNFGLGAVQFPYFTRRIENIFHTSILNQIYDSDVATFENRGLAANFFRTAVHTTFIDFGIVISLFFVFACGTLAGIMKKICITFKSPFYIAFQGLICAGSAWTIIFSPFVEQSWAFPIIFFTLIIIFIYYIKPFFDAATTPITQNLKKL